MLYVKIRSFIGEQIIFHSRFSDINSIVKQEPRKTSDSRCGEKTVAIFSTHDSAVGRVARSSRKVRVGLLFNALATENFVLGTSRYLGYFSILPRSRRRLYEFS